MVDRIKYGIWNMEIVKCLEELYTYGKSPTVTMPVDKIITEVSLYLKKYDNHHPAFRQLLIFYDKYESLKNLHETTRILMQIAKNNGIEVKRVVLEKDSDIWDNIGWLKKGGACFIACHGTRKEDCLFSIHSTAENINTTRFISSLPHQTSLFCISCYASEKIFNLPQLHGSCCVVTGYDATYDDKNYVFSEQEKWFKFFICNISIVLVRLIKENKNHPVTPDIIELMAKNVSEKGCGVRGYLYKTYFRVV